MSLLPNCYGVETTLGPVRAPTRLRWPPVNLSLTPCSRKSHGPLFPSCVVRHPRAQAPDGLLVKSRLGPPGEHRVTPPQGGSGAVRPPETEEDGGGGRARGWEGYGWATSVWSRDPLPAWGLRFGWEGGTRAKGSHHRRSPTRPQGVPIKATHQLSEGSAPTASCPVVP